MTRKAKTVVAAVNVDKYQDALSMFAQADAREKQITSKMDVEITRIREKHAAELKQLAEQKETHFEVIQTYCEENQELLFNKRKSMDTAFGVLGFRTGTPKLKLVRGFSWVVVLDNLKAYLPDYVRKIEEPAKDRLLADRDKVEVMESLQKVGLKVDQDETFFIDLKKEDAAA